TFSGKNVCTIARRERMLKSIEFAAAFVVLSATASAQTFTEFSPPTANNGVSAITKGPDGNLWISETNVNKFAKLTTAGVFTESTNPSGITNSYSITTGPDGNLWATEFQNPGHIDRITTAGVVTQFPFNSLGLGITSGPDGNLWMVDDINM